MIVYAAKTVPTVPLAVAALDITGMAGLIVIVKTFVPVPVIFVALSVSMNVPATVGVPLIIPVAVLIDNPAGNPVTA